MRRQKTHSLILLLVIVFTSVAAAVLPEDSSHGLSETGDGTSATQATIHLSPEQRQMIGVTYGTVEQTSLKKTIRAVGRIDFDERRLADVNFKIGG